MRLRARKGSGRASEALYRVGTRAVVDAGADFDEIAVALELEAGMLDLWVKNLRFARED